MYETVTEAFLHAGFSQGRIVSAIVALESFIFGSAYDVTAPPDIFEPGSMADTNPNIAAAVRGLTEREFRDRADTAFTLGLGALISAIGKWQNHG
jgi:hypothetical protein